MRVFFFTKVKTINTMENYKSDTNKTWVQSLVESRNKKSVFSEEYTKGGYSDSTAKKENNISESESNNNPITKRRQALNQMAEDPFWEYNSSQTKKNTSNIPSILGPSSNFTSDPEQVENYKVSEYIKMIVKNSPH